MNVNIFQNCNRFFGTETPSATASILRFKFILGRCSSFSSLLLPFVTGIGSLWPTVGAGLFEKYSILSASAAEQRLCGYIASSLSANSNKSSLAAVNTCLSGIPGNTLN